MINNEKIGLTIKTLRVQNGMTQQQLADKLNVTDKAVSKWERGIGLPDISIINQLAIILNIDTDNLLCGNIAYLETEWIGELRIDEFDSKISIDSEILGKPNVYMFLCYFALVGIKNIYIYCSKNDEKKIKTLIKKDRIIGLNLFYNEKIPSINKKKMVINRPIFLYGPNLTKYFQRAMLHKGKRVYLSAMTELDNSNMLLCDSKNQLSNKITSKQKYNILPIYFENCNENNKCCTYEMLGRGMIVIPYNTIYDLLNISNLISIIQNYSGEKIYDIKEIIQKRGLLEDK